MYKIFASLLILIIPFIGFSQTAEILGMGNTRAARNDIHALFGNQAGLAQLESTSMLVSTERRFNLAAISNHSAGIAIPTKAGTFGLAVNYFGFSEYNEQKIGIAYARKLGKKFNVGAQFDYIGTRIRDFGTANTYTVEVGVLANINKKLDLGAHFFNPIGVDRGIDTEPLESIVSIGLRYQASAQFLIMADVEAELDFPPRYKLGIDYSLSNLIQLRIGAYTEPTTVSFGIGLNINDKFILDLASSYQTALGITPGIGIRYDLESKK